MGKHPERGWVLTSVLQGFMFSLPTRGPCAANKLWQQKPMTANTKQLAFHPQPTAASSEDALLAPGFPSIRYRLSSDRAACLSSSSLARDHSSVSLFPVSLCRLCSNHVCALIFFPNLFCWPFLCTLSTLSDSIVLPRTMKDMGF